MAARSDPFFKEMDHDDFFEDWRSPSWNNRRPHDGNDGIPIQVFHEKVMPSGGKHPFVSGRKSTNIPVFSERSSPRLERAHSEPPKSFGQKLAGVSTPKESSIPENTANPPQENVRHIPIFVEGRDAPIFSRKVSSESKGVSETPSSLGEDLSSKIEPSSPMGPPEGPIPMGCAPHYFEPSSNSPKNSLPSDLSESSVYEPPSSVDPALDKVNKIKNHLNEIQKQIEGFTGSKKDKEYLLLDEMLTRYLLELDCIDSGGREEIRQIRKESIKSVNRCLSLLDSQASQISSVLLIGNEDNSSILSELAKTSESEMK